MAGARRILLLIETSKAYGRCLLDGIGRFAEAHGGWSLYVEERGLYDRQPAWLRQWKGDGVIFRSNSQAMVAAIAACGVPAVDTNTKILGHGFPLVYADEGSVAQVAVAHFRERCFDNFGFCSIEEEPWVEMRRNAYVAELARLGQTCHCKSVGGKSRRSGWKQQLRELANWVTRLPKPIAIFAANDVAGVRLINACADTGVAVPEQVAVLGADNDSILDRLSTPALSSVDLNACEIGYEAASLLHRLMLGESAPDHPILLQPAGIAVRQSSDVTAVPDPQLAAALTFIRRRACDGISVNDVVQSLDISRATLERRFSDHLRRTPKEEILRVRMEQVKRMILLTDYALADIAERTGFPSASHMSVAFKKFTGYAPSEYRRQRPTT